MNMISTGAFQTEMNASNKQSELVKKLVGAWEKKNAKVVRAGGVSLMALTLAACGGDDDTPFSQADVDAAKVTAKAEGVAEGVASVDITSDNAAIAETAKAEGVASVDITTDNAAAIVDAITTATSGAFTTVASLFDAYTTANNPAGLSLALTDDDSVGVSFDNPAMTAASDSLTATSATFDATDIVADSSSTDNDILTITATGDVTAAATVLNVETVNFNLNAAGAAGGALSLSAGGGDAGGAVRLVAGAGQAQAGGAVEISSGASTVDRSGSLSLGTASSAGGSGDVSESKTTRRTAVSATASSSSLA